MAHRRRSSVGDAIKSPHTVSLKVLRLSQPALALQYSLANPQELGISADASLAYPSGRRDDRSVLSPVLNLPEAFGSAHVGEAFSCTLCANSELDARDATRAITAIRMQADMQTPSNPAGSPLSLAGGDAEGDAAPTLDPGANLQRILRFELKEEGNHVLAVTVTYTETLLAGEGQAASGRLRTFRKLYQFVALQLLSVRTKAGPRRGADGSKQFLLEAQIENTGEGVVALEDVSVNASSPYCSTSLNRDAFGGASGDAAAPVLNSHDVMQVAFLLKERASGPETTEAGQKMVGNEAGKTLGQLAIQWRSAHGDRGNLSTGWLTSRR